MILLFRYNSDEYAYCLSNAVLNITQEPGICTGRTLGYLHGIHDDNEHDLDRDAELSNAMVLLVNAGFIAGSVGSITNDTGHDIRLFDRKIEANHPVFCAFFGIENEVSKFKGMIAGYQRGQSNGKRNHSGELFRDGQDSNNTFIFIQLDVIFISEGEEEAEPPSRHWANIQRSSDGRWWGSHGIRNANIFRIKEENLATLLFTSQGKNTLTAFIQKEFGNATVSVAQGRGTEEMAPYLFLPKIQKKPIKEWTVDERDNGLIKSLVTTVKNNHHKRSEIHTCQIVELDDARTITDLDLTLSDNMDGSPFMTAAFLADKSERQWQSGR